MSLSCSPKNYQLRSESVGPAIILLIMVDVKKIVGLVLSLSKLQITGI
jgi:hypothetical protein